MCFKLIWRVLTARSLWVDWIKDYLIQEGSFWSVVDHNNKGSWIWHKLLKYREYAKDYHKVEVGTGNTVSFWYDNWCELGKLWEITGSRGIIDMGIGQDAKISDISVLRRRRNHRNAMLNQMEEELDKVRNSTGVADTHKWRNSRGEYKNIFSTKETWESIRDVKPKVQWYRGIWFKQATPKYAFLAWLAIRNRLATGERVIQWSRSYDPNCVLCYGVTETVPHLFFDCAFSTAIWTALVRGVMRNQFSTSWSFLVYYLAENNLNKVDSFLLRYAFQVSIHLIWYERNRWKHGESPISSANLQMTISSIIKNKIHSIRAYIGMEDALLGWFSSRI